MTDDFGPVKVPDNKYFVMGDNRGIPWTAVTDLASSRKNKLRVRQSLFSTRLTKCAKQIRVKQTHWGCFFYIFFMVIPQNQNINSYIYRKEIFAEM